MLRSLLGALAIGGIVACNSSNNGAPPVPPGPVLASASPFPATNGDTFAFAGIESQNSVFTYPSPGPSLPPFSQNLNVTQSVTVSNAAPPPNLTAPAGASDFQTLENDIYPLRTFVTTTNTFYTQNSASVLDYGYSTSDSVGDVLTVSYKPSQTILELPLGTAKQWSNAPTAVINEDDADNITSVRTIASDGSYSETETFPYNGPFGSGGMGTSQLVAKPDGSGFWSSDQSEASLFGLFARASYSRPQSGAACAPLATCIVLSLYADPAGTMLLQTVPIPAWFAAGTPLYSDSTSSSEAKFTTSVCNLPAAFGSAGVLVSRAVNQIDPAFGTQETTTTNVFVLPGFGPACVLMSDTTKFYYSYLLDTPFILNLSGDGTPLQTTTITESLTLQASGTSIQSRARTASLQPLSTQAIAAATTNFARLVERQRHQRVRAFLKALVAHAQSRGAVR